VEAIVAKRVLPNPASMFVVVLHWEANIQQRNVVNLSCEWPKFRVKPPLARLEALVFRKGISPRALPEINLV